MKKNLFSFFKTTTAILLMLVLTHTAKASQTVVTDSASLSQAIVTSLSGDTIRLNPAGLFRNASGFTITDKVLTFKPTVNSTVRPILLTYFKVVTTASITSKAGIVFDSIEFKGTFYLPGAAATVINYLVQISTAGTGSTFPKFVFNDCYAHHFGRSCLYTNQGAVINSFIVKNSRFYSFLGNSDSYNVFGLTSSSNSVDSMVISECTFSNIKGPILRNANNKATPKQKIYIDKCTFDSINSATSPFNIAASTATGNVFSFTNSILSNFHTVTNIWTRVLFGKTLCNVSNTRYYKVRAADSAISTVVTLDPSYSFENPQYVDSSKGNYTLKNVNFLTASTTGNIIGDPRWNPADAYLTSMSVNGTTLAGFDKTIYKYSLMLPFGTTVSPSITFTQQNLGSSVVSTPYGVDSTVVWVTAPNGYAKYKYLITYFFPSSDATLKTLTYKGESILEKLVLKGGSYVYSVMLPKGSTVVPDNGLFAYTTNHSMATSTIAQAATTADTTIIEVTAQNGATKQAYKIGFYNANWHVVVAKDTTWGTVSIKDGVTEFMNNSQTQITAVPDSGHYFVQWTRNKGIHYSYAADTVLTITEDDTLKAVFAPYKRNVTVALNPIDGGLVSGIPTDKVNHGDEVTLTATPAENFAFIKWTSGLTTIGSEASLKLKVTKDTSIVANFLSTLGSRIHHVTADLNDTVYKVATSLTTLSGDTIMLASGEYHETFSWDISKSLVIMAEPSASTKPLVKSYAAGIRFTKDHVYLVVKGIEFEGWSAKPIATAQLNNNAKFIDLLISLGVDSIKYIKIESCDIHNFNKGISLSSNNALLDSLVLRDVIWHDKNSAANTNAPIIAFGNKGAARLVSITNSTFYNINGDLMDSPTNPTGETGNITPKMSVIVDHNTFFNVISLSKSLIQTVNVVNDSLTYKFTNNVVAKLRDSANSQPFNISVASGSVLISNNSFYKFTPRIYKFSYDSLSNLGNVTRLGNLFIDPQLTDTSTIDGTPVNFSYPSTSQLLKSSATEGPLGDPRWFPIVLQQILVTAANNSITVDNGQLQMEASFVPSSTTETSVTWMVKELSGKATISATGLLTAVKNGKVVVIAVSNTSSDIFGSDTITISNQVVPVESISVPGVTYAEVGRNAQMTAIVLPDYSDNSTITWSVVAGTGTASIDASTGILTPGSEGTVTVIATAADGSGITKNKLVTISASGTVALVTSLAVYGEGDASVISAYRDSLQMVTYVMPKNAKDSSVVWSVSPASVASISGSGKLFALTNGNVTVKATTLDGSGISAEKVIAITGQNRVKTIKISGEGGASSIAVRGGTLQMIAAVYPDTADIKSVTWSIASGSEKASISASGLLTAVSDGSVYVQATANDGSGVFATKEIAITRQVSVQSITVLYGFQIVNSAIDTLTSISNKGGYLLMQYKVLPVNAGTKTVTWTVENGKDVDGKGAATVDQTGNLVAVSSGTVRVIATAQDGTGIAGFMDIVITNQNPVARVYVASISGKSTLAIGDTMTIVATYSPLDADNITATTWSINDVTKATISSEGLLTGVSEGAVKVKATIGGVYKTLDITISGHVNVSNSSTASIEISPNPASDFIQIKSDAKSDVSISNLLGSLVLSEQVDANGKINIQNLKAGLYIVTIKSGNISKSVRIIKE